MDNISPTPYVEKFFYRYGKGRVFVEMDNRSQYTGPHFLGRKNSWKNFLTTPTLEPGFHLWGKDEFYGERKLSPHRQNRGFSFYGQKIWGKIFLRCLLYRPDFHQGFFVFYGGGF